MSTCEIQLFGTPTVTKDGSAQPGLRSKSLALLAYLAMEDRPIRRDTVATLLWPDSGQSAARPNLRNCLFEIKHTLPQGAVVAEGGALRLDAENVRIDVREFLMISEEQPSAETIARCCPAGFVVSNQADIEQPPSKQSYDGYRHHHLRRSSRTPFRLGHSQSDA